MTTKPATPDNRYPAGEQADLTGNTVTGAQYTKDSERGE